ncbi:MAG: hypothetical protein ABI679_09525 [Gemmatimonadota bacterium]
MARISLALLVLIPATAYAQRPPVGIIDFFGVRTVRETDLRRVLPIHEGDPSPDSLGPIIRALESVPGVRKASANLVRKASANLVCCEDLKSILYLGIEESASALPPFRAAPGGSERLPGEIVAAGEGFSRALESAVSRGDGAEDDAQGHALFHDPATRAYQIEFIGFARRDISILRRVLSNSSVAAHRALAAQVIAYSARKREVVPDLVAAARDHRRKCATALFERCQ